MAENGQPSPEKQVRALYEQAESQAAKALEDLVSSRSFGNLMAMATENLAAVVRLGADITDATWRSLRIAGRADITRLARQLQRTEDKLERLLQEIEALRDQTAGNRSRSKAP